MNTNIIRYELIEQKNNKTKGNIYHFSQVNFAYNSNKIEGSKLTEEETEEIFTDSTITKDNIDDVIETKNHFKLFNYILDNIDKELSIDNILEMNKILKKNTSYENNPNYNVGGFKTIPNTIGVINTFETSSPEDVEKALNELLNWYKKFKKVTIEDIIEFHVRFERIHPFGDGNGRVGRMIMFKECLKHDIMPFIILDDHRSYYMRGLKEYNNDKLFLIDTIKNEQDIYENICNDLLDINVED